MNLPNKLTVLRMCLVPVFLLFMLCPAIPDHYLWAAVVFVAASLTDMLDGRIARKHNLVTDFGKFMDPLADKILVMAAMLCFVELGWAHALVVIIIIAREFLVTSLRLVAAGSGKVIAADLWGKLKTIFQMVWIIYTILAVWVVEYSGIPHSLGAPLEAAAAAYGISLALMWISTLLTIISGFNYVWKNRACINTAK